SPSIDFDDEAPAEEEHTEEIELEEDDEVDRDNEFEKVSLWQKLKARFKRQAPIEEDDDEEEVSDAEDVKANEVVEDEDEADNTQDAIKNSIYIPKSKSDEIEREAEEEQDSSAPKKIKKAPKKIRYDDLVGFLSRFYGFVAEIIIASGIVINAAPIFELQPFYTQIYTDLLPILTDLQEKIISLQPQYEADLSEYLPIIFSPTIINIFITWLIINIFANLLFASNLGLGLMGATTDGSFIMARAKAIIRFFIGIVTFP